MNEARAWLKPWVVVMFGAIAAVVVWRLAASPSPSKLPSEASVARAPLDPPQNTVPIAPTTTAVMPTEFATATPTAAAGATVTATSTGVATATVVALPPALIDPTPPVPGQASEPTLDPAALKARQARSITLLEKRIAALEQAARAAQTKGDPAEVQRLQDQTAQAKRRLALMRLETE